MLLPYGHHCGWNLLDATFHRDNFKHEVCLSILCTYYVRLHLRWMPLTSRQLWARSWLGAIRQQAITWVKSRPKFLMSLASLISQWVVDLFSLPWSACVITWLCTDSPLPDCYIVLLITSKHPTHSNTGTVTVAELSCTHSFPHNDPMHGFGDECVQYYSQPQSCTHV